MSPGRARIARRARALQAVAAILIGVAIFGTIWGATRIALAAAVLGLFVQLFTVEALRVLVCTPRENP